jgi:predicted small lipoprotein YifL
MIKANRLLKSMLILLLVFFLAACSSNSGALAPEGDNAPQQNTQNNQAPENDDQQQEVEQPPSTEAIQLAWESSAHANTFLVDGEGQNNSCAQCHAPVDWQPSMDTIPESCFTCKFELDDPPPYISDEDWEDIPCMVCHELNKKDEVQPEYKWLEIAAIGEYADVETTTELCLKCHSAEEPLVGHTWVAVEGIHQEKTCTDCHNPHDTKAACVNCHAEIDFTASETAGHDQDHLQIACAACHDGSGLAVDLDADSNTWQVFVESQDGTLIVGSSHNLVLEVACTRCHFSENSWGLSVQP